MNTNDVKEQNIKSNNKGFSIVELIVSIAVLSIVFIPIINAFLSTVRTNAKAQRMQNATAVAQDVMETVKRYSFEELKISDALEEDVDGISLTRDSQTESKVVFSGSNITNTSSEKFSVEVSVESVENEDHTVGEAGSEKFVKDEVLKLTEENPFLKDESSTSKVYESNRKINKIKVIVKDGSGAIKATVTSTMEDR